MRLKVLAVMFALSLVSCTKVPMGKLIEPKYDLVYSVSWNDTDSLISRPSAFDMAVARTLKTEHMFWNALDTAGTAKTDTLHFDRGEYQSLIFYAEGDYLYENLDAFRMDNAVSLRDVCARLPRWNHADFNSKFGDFEQSLVSYCDTVDAAPRLFRSSLRYNLPQKADSLGVSRITYTPEILSRAVTFQIKINAESGLVLHRVVATIVGLPVRIELLSGLLDTGRENLGQTMFELHPSATDPSLYEGTVWLLGIVPPSSVEAVSGSGILQVYMEEGPSRRKIRRILNMYRYLAAAPLLYNTDVEGWARGDHFPVVYTIDTPIYLTSNTTSTGDEAVSEWLDPEDDNVKDIIDGQDDETEL